MTAVATILDAYILTGQSLAGGVAEAVSTAVIPFRQAWMLAGGPIFRADSPLNGTLVPLVENRVETLCSAFAEQRLADNDRPLVIIGAAAGGKAAGAATFISDFSVLLKSAVGAAAMPNRVSIE